MSGLVRTVPYECNLHRVWDSSMILRTGLWPREYADRLEGLILAERLDATAGGSPEQWANESVQLARAAWVQDGADLDDGYYHREIRVADRC